MGTIGSSEALTCLLAYIMFSFPGGSCDETPDIFYENCASPSSICSGIGLSADCIKDRNCKFAGGISENDTHFTWQYYENTRTDDTTRPCTAIINLLNNMYETTTWVGGTGFVTQLHCKDQVRLKDFWTVLYVNKSRPCDVSVEDQAFDLGEALSTRILPKNTDWKSECESSLTTNDPSRKVAFSTYGKIVSVAGIRTKSNLCRTYNGSFMEWPTSWSAVFKNLRPLDAKGVFFTNIESIRETKCPAAPLTTIGSNPGIQSGSGSDSQKVLPTLVLAALSLAHFII